MMINRSLGLGIIPYTFHIIPCILLGAQIWEQPHRTTTGTRTRYPAKPFSQWTFLVRPWNGCRESRSRLTSLGSAYDAQDVSLVLASFRWRRHSRNCQSCNLTWAWIRWWRISHSRLKWQRLLISFESAIFGVASWNLTDWAIVGSFLLFNAI